MLSVIEINMKKFGTMKEKIYNYILNMNGTLFISLSGICMFGSLYYGMYASLVSHKYVLGLIIPMVGYGVALWGATIRSKNK